MLTNTVETVKRRASLAQPSSMRRLLSPRIIDKNFLMFSKPMTHDEFLSSLKNGKAVETKSRGYEAA
jgi:hypothetical protein